MLEKFRVLMINDNISALKVMQNIVRHHRMLSTVFAESGAKALEMIEQDQPYHIIVSDLSSDQSSHVNILQTAKHRSPDTKVVVITGFGDNQVIIDAIKTGVYAYLHKPYRPEELNLVLNNLTRHFQQVQKIDHLKQEISDLEVVAQKKFFRIQNLEESVAKLKGELSKIKGKEDSVLDLNMAIAKAAAEKTGPSTSYNVFRELTNLNNLLEEKKISEDEFQNFRRNVLEKAYQVPIS